MASSTENRVGSGQELVQFQRELDELRKSLAQSEKTTQESLQQ